MAYNGARILGTLTYNATGAGTTAIGATSNTGTIAIGNGSSAAVTIDCGTAGLTLGTTANAHQTTVGSTNTTSTTTVQSGSGLLQIASTNGSIAMLSGTGNLSISDDAAATLVKVATGAGVKNLTLGSTNTTSNTTLQSGSGALNVTATGGALTINSGVGALGISTDSSATTLSIGTGAAVKAITLGSTNTTSGTTINSGSAGVKLIGVASVVVSNKNYVTINTSTGALGSDNAPLSSISITGDTGGALTGSSFTFSGGTTGLSFGGSGSTETLSGTLIVANGGTGRTTLTNHGVLVGAGATAITQLAVGATGTVLQGSTGADPAFTATPTVTSISFGGSSLSTFTDWTTWTPTIDGSSSGTTTYTTQFGEYMRIGNLVIAQFNVSYSAATGTANMTLGGLPFTVDNTTSAIFQGTVKVSGAGQAWPVGSTHLTVQAVLNTTTALINATGTAVGNAFMQMANTAVTVQGVLIYRA